MSIGATNQALAAYRAAAGEIAGGKPATTAAGIGSFDGLLQAELRSTLATLEASEQASIDAVSGRVGIQQVVEAITAAELDLQKITAVRDRVISAYQEIIRMPI